MKKYGIIIECFEYDDKEHRYLDNISKLFDTKESAQQQIQQSLLDEFDTLNGDFENDWTIHGNELWNRFNDVVSRYIIMEFE